MVGQHSLTIITPVNPSQSDRLIDLLNQVQHPNVESNKLIPFSKIKSIHFARFVYLNSKAHHFGPQLIFLSDYDGKQSTHIRELVREAKGGLSLIYGCCIGFTGDIGKYWNLHKVRTNAFYNGHSGLSVQRIKYEECLRTAIVEYLNQAYDSMTIRGLSAIEIKQRVMSFVTENSQLKSMNPEPQETLLNKFIFQRKALSMALLSAALGLIVAGYTFVAICKWLNIGIGVGVIGIIVFIVGLFFFVKKKLNNLENSDRSEIKVSGSKHVLKLMNAENFQIQNQLTHLVEIKKGHFRLRLLKSVLTVLHLLSKTYFNKGSLGSITSIHFARWVVIDEEKRLIFFSNFDGSWESYLGEFVDKASTGLTAVWSNTKNFPKSYNLVLQGARDEQRFKEWARQLQIPTQIWYSAYPLLSVENINNNSFIHSQLYRKLNEEKAQLWLDRLFIARD